MDTKEKTSSELLQESMDKLLKLPENVLSPSHYEQHKIQVMEFCQVNNLGWCASNVIKYVCRENKKNGLEDLKKARQYLDCLINYKETGVFLTPDKLGEKK